MGGLSDQSAFYAMDLDYDGNLALGGGSKDANLCPSGSWEVPILTYLQNEGLLMWSKQIVGGSPTFEKVQVVRFDPTFDQIAVILDKFYVVPLTIMIFSTTDGTVLK